MRIYELRHSFASFLINQGRSLYVVQRILGHSQIKTTQRYAYLSHDSLLDAANTASLKVPWDMTHQTEEVLLMLDKPEKDTT